MRREANGEKSSVRPCGRGQIPASGGEGAGRRGGEAEASRLPVAGAWPAFLPAGAGDPGGSAPPVTRSSEGRKLGILCTCIEAREILGWLCRWEEGGADPVPLPRRRQLSPDGRWKGRAPGDGGAPLPPIAALCSGFMTRHSRLQREVLGLYRQFLRACRGKPGFLPRVQAEFRRAARIPRTDVLLIEYLLRRGQRQLAQLREGHATRMGFFAPGQLQQQEGKEKDDAQS